MNPLHEKQITTSMSHSHSAISLRDIQTAAARIAAHVIRTPLVRCEQLSQRWKCDVHFKAENLQHVGAFKARGAINAVLSLDSDVAPRGVVTHSSGNHAAALARAASLRQIPAHVVMPHNSPANKLAAVRSYGVEPVLCEPNSAAREEAARKLRDETGATLIHPFNDPQVMAGQGTVGLEILEQLPEVDAVIVPVGGGGLLSGVLMAIKSQYPDIAVYAAEPEWADDAARSLKSGRIELPARYDTVADGLRTHLGDLTFPIIRALVNDILVVSEEAILAATRTMLRDVRLVAEPSGAVALAALAENYAHFEGQRVAVVVSGGNLDLDGLKRL
ncbi:threonine ammonia-lyase [Aureliella helgolandensis]|uniref:L-threonine dehydratase catabolic TdcB n=1 Tax=Aureliella helgolandensis TaxID=2527968 RepID=A0A518G0I4_9BACT|nr:pyridoxal-phosphate dependent enzyme [Aureliella helgolandensis]QDV22086.1 L-threonine dehydratase catabolic TdcB [Aureliella helgolandensis]